jgi:hypothetical protein
LKTYRRLVPGWLEKGPSTRLPGRPRIAAEKVLIAPGT